MAKSDSNKFCNSKDDKNMSINFLRKFRNKDTMKLNQFTATQFLDVWKHFDVDCNGYIEEHELDKFLIQFVTSVIADPIAVEVVSQTAYKDMKKEFLAAYDDNEDGKIEIGEMAQILPLDEEFLVLFQRENPLKSSVQFMKVWKEFDKDCSGYIESDELSDFIRYLLTHACTKSTDIDATVKQYSDIILKLFDKNDDGKLQLSEMARLLPVKENYIARPIINNSKGITYLELDRIFKMYDDDCNGQMENHELQGLLKDLLDLCGEDYDQNTLENLQKIILTEWDVNHDGKINKKELKMIMTQHARLEDLQKESQQPIFPEDDLLLF